MYESKTAYAYPNLRKEMEHRKINISKLAKMIGLSINTLIYKIAGNREFKLWEAIEIKRALKTDTPIEILFEKA